MNQILPGAENLSLIRSWLWENQIPFTPARAGKFIRFSNVQQSTPTDLKIQLFLENLKKNPKRREDRS